MYIHIIDLNHEYAPAEYAAWKASGEQLGYEHPETRRLKSICLLAQEEEMDRQGMSVPAFLRKQCD